MLSEDELDDLITDTRFQQGRDYERERIIALLETLKCKCDDDCDMVESPFHILIPFIKGEYNA